MSLREAVPEAVVVFGASGFVGRNIVDALAGRTRVIGVNASGATVPGCDTVVAAAAPDEVTLPADAAIIHVAAYRYFASRFGKQHADILSANAR